LSGGEVKDELAVKNRLVLAKVPYVGGGSGEAGLAATSTIAAGIAPTLRTACDTLLGWRRNGLL
jgi:hypothetical protein